GDVAHHAGAHLVHVLREEPGCEDPVGPGEDRGGGFGAGRIEAEHDRPARPAHRGGREPGGRVAPAVGTSATEPIGVRPPGADALRTVTNSGTVRARTPGGTPCTRTGTRRVSPMARLPRSAPSTSTVTRSGSTPATSERGPLSRSSTSDGSSTISARPAAVSSAGAGTTT